MTTNAAVEPSYFQPGYGHQQNPLPLHGRKGHHHHGRHHVGRTHHGHAGVHGRMAHGSPMPHIADPWKHAAMGKNKR